MTNNIDPLLWGPHGWHFMHYITFAYPINPSTTDKENMSNFFTSLKNILPCDSCRTHFETHLKKNPLTNEALASRQSLVDWLINIHNEVNIMNHKPTVSNNDVMKYYSSKSQNVDYKYYIGIIIVVLLLIFILKKSNVIKMS